jgi:aminoglycoside phosphotransferase family enzyme
MLDYLLEHDATVHADERVTAGDMQRLATQLATFHGTNAATSTAAAASADTLRAFALSNFDETQRFCGGVDGSGGIAVPTDLLQQPLLNEALHAVLGEYVRREWGEHGSAATTTTAKTSTSSSTAETDAAKAVAAIVAAAVAKTKAAQSDGWLPVPGGALALLRARANSGCVVDGHGDMHCGNVCRRFMLKVSLGLVMSCLCSR